MDIFVVAPATSNIISPCEMSFWRMHAGIWSSGMITIEADGGN